MVLDNDGIPAVVQKLEWSRGHGIMLIRLFNGSHFRFEEDIVCAMCSAPIDFLYEIYISDNPFPVYEELGNALVKYGYLKNMKEDVNKITLRNI